VHADDGRPAGVARQAIETTQRDASVTVKPGLTKPDEVSVPAPIDATTRGIRLAPGALGSRVVTHLGDVPGHRR
jgi:hypothetical protein